MRFEPFADDSASIEVAGLTVENGTGRISLYGTADIDRARDGLAKARSLRDLLDRVVRALEAEPDLPARAPPPRPTRRVRNPFS